jgi:hypothetical protein
MFQSSPWRMPCTMLLLVFMAIMTWASRAQMSRLRCRRPQGDWRPTFSSPRSPSSVTLSTSLTIVNRIRRRAPLRHLATASLPRPAARLIRILTTISPTRMRPLTFPPSPVSTFPHSTLMRSKPPSVRLNPPLRVISSNMDQATGWISCSIPSWLDCEGIDVNKYMDKKGHFIWCTFPPPIRCHNLYAFYRPGYTGKNAI